MWWLMPDSKEYNDLDTACKKGMRGIKNPEYKAIYSR